MYKLAFSVRDGSKSWCAHTVEYSLAKRVDCIRPDEFHNAHWERRSSGTELPTGTERQNETIVYKKAGGSNIKVRSKSEEWLPL